MAINTAVTGDSVETTTLALASEFLTVEPLDDGCLQRYHDALKRAREEKGEVSISVHNITSTCPHCLALDNG